MRFIGYNVLFNMIFALLYCYFSPTTRTFFSPMARSIKGVANTFVEIPRYWLKGSENVPSAISKTFDLVTTRPDLLLQSPVFWAGSIGLILALYFVLTCFFTETKTKLALIAVVLFCTNIVALEAYFNYYPVIQNYY